MSFISFLSLASIAAAINITVSSSGGNASAPLAYGLMFEDINHSGDGGIYAELIQNRAFQGNLEYPSTLSPWVPIGNAVLTLQNTSIPLSSALPTSVNVSKGNSTNSTGIIGLSNPGWWGISVQNQPYTGSFWAYGSYTGPFTIKLVSDLTSEVSISQQIPSLLQPGKWVEYKFTLEPRAAPNSNNSFVIEFPEEVGSLNFNLISLFPPTYKGRENGNRVELMEALEKLNPSFFRIPGGNNIEGDSFHYQWKWNETIGPLTERPGRPGTWGYTNTDGLGLVEYMNWCTDLNVTPVLAVWAGLYLQDGYELPADVIPEDEIDIYVQDTLNELEFLLGPVSSTYGSLRASLGYPEPWVIKHVEIGNEDDLGGGETSYVSYRWPAFYNAIHAAYPDIIIISSTGDLDATGAPGTSGTDYHEYARADEMASQFTFLDNNDRDYKVLLGEYAVIQVNSNDTLDVDWDAAKLPWPQWIGAVGEAVYLLGSERNSDVVIGASYAPGFQNLNSYEWAPDLISFTADPSQTVLSTSWHQLQLLSNSRYTSTVPFTSSEPFGPAYYIFGITSPTHYTFKAAIYNSTTPIPFSIDFDGLSEGSTATLTILNAPSGPEASNVLGGEEVVQKKVLELEAGSGGVFEFVLQDYDVAVLTT